MNSGMDEIAKAQQDAEALQQQQMAEATKEKTVALQDELGSRTRDLVRRYGVAGGR